ncbi:PREDICTED: glutamate receptor ionotropic, kainate 2 isoform X2 [Bactrocera latifrons]|uniref:glutamate receptor ionotropic, kainate 2 isoform X2 n=1 Tax=Bactrocera latifrons TaxID=174628 RepID=UPI0008DD8471|nr:PREDICTED: glutamate receptor ionotropic, kainate 2 isoform X2 [Bactrocera latifrons]
MQVQNNWIFGILYTFIIYVKGFANIEENEGISIGIISDDNMEPLQKTFNYAITVANTDLAIPLIGYNEKIRFGDSIEGHAKLCKFMQTGIGAIFGPSSQQTSTHLLTVCDAKDVPYIYPHMSENVKGFNLYPNPIDLARILHDIIYLFEWTHFTFLYESSEYLSILNGLMPFYGSDGPVINVLRYDLKLSGNFKAVLRRVRKSEDGHIVVVGSTPSVAELLKQAQQVGIMNDKYSYIIGNFDLQTFDLEEYKYSEANITGFRMFSPTQAIVHELISQLDMDYNENNNNQIANGSCPLTLEMAITYDAVQVFAESTKNLVYRPQALNCSEQSNQVQADGSTFKNYMRSINMQEKTITGPIYFDGNIRKGYSLDIVELQTSGLVKIGTWDERNNLTIQRPPQSELWSEVDANSLVNKTFRVLISVPNKPYASLVESHKKLVGNNQYEGYSIDLIKELAAKLGFNYTFIDGGSDYGSFNKTTNKTTGMMKEINEGLLKRADLAITDLTITSEREEIIDFSIPFMNLGIAILYTQPQKSPANNFSFMDPFSRQVWIYLGLVYIGVSFCFFILGRLSPTEWDNPYPCIEEPEELENQFTLNNSFWFTTGAFLQQGSEIAPNIFLFRSLSTRTLASIWWFFTLIILSSYTANLAAFLTIEKPVGLINNVNELASDTRVKYGAKKTGSTRSFFSTSEHETYKKMNDFMVENPDLLFETNLEGVNRVKTDNNYAFLMESTSIEYHIVRECNLKKVGEPLDEKGYGIAMVKNWPYRDKFNNALLELQEQGVLARLKNKWWNEVGAGVCKKKSDSSEVNPLDLKSLGGVYLVLGVGSGLSLIYSLIMWCIYVARKSNYYEVPFGDAFLEELRIAIDVANKERILKSAQSVYSRSRNSLVSIDSIDTDSEIENSSKTDGESEKTI